MTPSQTVAAFISAVEAQDLHTAATLLAPDVRYENVPVNPVVGRDATVAALSRFLAPVEDVEWVVVREIADGLCVANERVDRFKFPAGWLELPVAGFFEVHDGVITLWRDYFDLATYTTQLQKFTSA